MYLQSIVEKEWFAILKWYFIYLKKKGAIVKQILGIYSGLRWIKNWLTIVPNWEVSVFRTFMANHVARIFLPLRVEEGKPFYPYRWFHFGGNTLLRYSKWCVSRSVSLWMHFMRKILLIIFCQFNCLIKHQFAMFWAYQYSSYRTTCLSGQKLLHIFCQLAFAGVRAETKIDWDHGSIRWVNTNVLEKTIECLVFSEAYSRMIYSVKDANDGWSDPHVDTGWVHSITLSHVYEYMYMYTVRLSGPFWKHHI